MQTHNNGISFFKKNPLSHHRLTDRCMMVLPSLYVWIHPEAREISRVHSFPFSDPETPLEAYPVSFSCLHLPSCYSQQGKLSLDLEWLWFWLFACNYILYLLKKKLVRLTMYDLTISQRPSTMYYVVDTKHTLTHDTTLWGNNCKYLLTVVFMVQHMCVCVCVLF